MSAEVTGSEVSHRKQLQGRSLHAIVVLLLAGCGAPEQLSPVTSEEAPGEPGAESEDAGTPGRGEPESSVEDDDVSISGEGGSHTDDEPSSDAEPSPDDDAVFPEPAPSSDDDVVFGGPSPSEVGAGGSEATGGAPACEPGSQSGGASQLPGNPTGGTDGTGGAEGTGGSASALMCETPPYFGGVLVTNVAQVAFDDFSYTLQHKRDIDEAEDGCIRRVEFAFRRGSGCELTVVAEDVLDLLGRLLVTRVEFSADSQCPDFADASQGVYLGSGSAIEGSWLTLDESRIDERNVATSCFLTAMGLDLAGTLETDDGQTLLVDGTELSVQGELASSAADGDCPAACRSDAHCSQTLICEQSECVPGCREDADCEPGRICENEQCSEACFEDDDCGVGSICENSRCETGCRVDAGCVLGQVCNNGQCSAGCRDDDGCGAGEICEGEQCTAGCRENVDCDSGYMCEDDVCVEIPSVSCEPPSAYDCTSDVEVTCACVGCWSDGLCTAEDDCVCPDCAEDAACGGLMFCDGNSVCSPFEEGCACPDCAGHPQCL